MSIRVIDPGVLRFDIWEPMATVSAPLSSTDPIDNGNTWTSDWVDVGGYESLVVAPKTDQDGIFYVDFSPDGTNVDSTLTRYYNTTDIEAPHRFTITRRFARIRFTNDSGSNQTLFRFQTLLGNHSNLNAPMDSTLARDFDAIVTRPTNPYHEEARGLRQDSSVWNKFGYNADVDAASEETIWSPGGLYVPPTTAYTVNIVSSDAADIVTSGTGAWNVYIYGIDENRVPISEIVNLNGVGTVTTTNSYLGINRAVVGYAGTGKVNAGTITLTHSTGGQVLAEIPIGSGTTQQCVFHVPANQDGLAEELMINVNKLSGSSPKVTIRGKSFSPVSNCNYEVFRVIIDTSVENTVILSPKIPFSLAESDVFQLTADTDTNNTIVTARFSLVVHKDPDAE